MNIKFKDHFSQQAADYTQYRPHYPQALFHYLASLSPTHQHAWDCATGNGQAAHGLTRYFERITATDASAKQIAHALHHPQITYVLTPAEQTPIEPQSVDLVVVAQALHWFHFDQFYAEVRRVLKPGGIIAVWSYQLLQIAPAINELIMQFYSGPLDDFWPLERRFVDAHYQTLPFPFREITAPDFQMEAWWDLDHLIGYLGTWSAVQRFKDHYHYDPVSALKPQLHQLWGPSAQPQKVYWPLALRIGSL